MSEKEYAEKNFKIGDFCEIEGYQGCFPILAINDKMDGRILMGSKSYSEWVHYSKIQRLEPQTKEVTL